MTDQEIEDHARARVKWIIESLERSMTKEGYSKALESIICDLQAMEETLDIEMGEEMDE